jgi:hypothetical protein
MISHRVMSTMAPQGRGKSFLADHCPVDLWPKALYFLRFFLQVVQILKKIESLTKIIFTLKAQSRPFPLPDNTHARATGLMRVSLAGSHPRWAVRTRAS